MNNKERLVKVIENYIEYTGKTKYSFYAPFIVIVASEKARETAIVGKKQKLQLSLRRVKCRIKVKNGPNESF